MPFVNIEWVSGQSEEKRAEVARRVNAAVSEVTGIPANMIWVVFNEVDDNAWFVGEKSVRQMRAGDT
jgi:4-oxalocrotonate tautomerase